MQITHPLNEQRELFFGNLSTKKGTGYKGDVFPNFMFLGYVMPFDRNSGFRSWSIYFLLPWILVQILILYNSETDLYYNFADE